MAPHTHPEPLEEPGPTDIEMRRLRITLEDLKKHELSPGCRTCQLHRQGLHARAKNFRHDEACRSRIYRAMRAAKGVVTEEEEKRLRPRDKHSLLWGYVI